MDLFQAEFLDPASDLGGDHFVFSDDQFVLERVDDRLAADATVDRIDQLHFDRFTAINGSLGDPLGRSAIVHRDDHVLGNVGQFTGQVTAVCGFERRIGQALTCTVGTGEILQNRQPFSEVRLDRRFENFAVRLGHHPSHTGQLTNLFLTTSSTRVGHQEHGVDVRTVATDVVLHRFHHVAGDFVTHPLPRVDDLTGTFLVGHFTATECLLKPHDFFFGLLDVSDLRFGRHQVVDRE